MKYIYILITVLFFSCGNVTHKNKFVITYKFENLNKVSANEMQGTIEVLNKRLEQFASNYEVKLNNKQQIEMTLSTNYDIEAINKIVTNPGKLDFWEVIKSEELGSFFLDANSVYKKENDTINPLFDLIQPNSFYYGSLFHVAVIDTAKLNSLLNTKQVKQLLPITTKQSKFLYGLPQDDGFLPLYIVRTTVDGIAYVNETHITDARQTTSVSGRPSIAMQMNKKGAERWERMTGLAHRQGSQIAMALNDVVYSAPTVSSGAITGGNTEISGSFTIDEAQKLALIFNTQKRIPKLKFVSSTAINDQQ